MRSSDTGTARLDRLVIERRIWSNTVDTQPAAGQMIYPMLAVAVFGSGRLRAQGVVWR